jgi:hypothetical protein
LFWICKLLITINNNILGHSAERPSNINYAVTEEDIKKIRVASQHFASSQYLQTEMPQYNARQIANAVAVNKLNEQAGRSDVQELVDNLRQLAIGGEVSCVLYYINMAMTKPVIEYVDSAGSKIIGDSSELFTKAVTHSAAVAGKVTAAIVQAATFNKKLGKSNNKLSEGDSILLAAAWVPTANILIAQKYPEVLEADFTVKVNKERLPYFQAVGVDGEFRSFVALNALVIAESSEMNLFVFHDCFSLLLPTVQGARLPVSSKRPSILSSNNVIITDQDAETCKAIDTQEELKSGTGSVHLRCDVHILLFNLLDDAAKHWTSAPPTLLHDVEVFLFYMRHVHTTTEFDICSEEFVLFIERNYTDPVGKAACLAFFRTNLQSTKRYWARAFSFDVRTLEISNNMRVENENRLCKRNRNLNLSARASTLLHSELARQQQRQKHQQVHDARQSSTTQSIHKDATDKLLDDVMTRAAYERQTDERQQACNYTIKRSGPGEFKVRYAAWASIDPNVDEIVDGDTVVIRAAKHLSVGMKLPSSPARESSHKNKKNEKDIDEKSLVPLFRRTHTVSLNVDGRLRCSCCTFERTLIVCRHMLAVLNNSLGSDDIHMRHTKLFLMASAQDCLSNACLQRSRNDGITGPLAKEQSFTMDMDWGDGNDGDDYDAAKREEEALQIYKSLLQNNFCGSKHKLSFQVWKHSTLASQWHKSNPDYSFLDNEEEENVFKQICVLPCSNLKCLSPDKQQSKDEPFSETMAYKSMFNEIKPIIDYGKLGPDYLATSLKFLKEITENFKNACLQTAELATVTAAAANDSKNRLKRTIDNNHNNNDEDDNEEDEEDEDATSPKRQRLSVKETELPVHEAVGTTFLSLNIKSSEKTSKRSLNPFEKRHG